MMNNGMNMQKMLKQAQKMRKQMMAEQQELAATEFTGQAPDGIVKVILTGDKKVKDLQIKPEVVDPDDIDMLSDLIVAAFNDGMSKVDSATQDKMGKYTRGLDM